MTDDYDDPDDYVDDYDDEDPEEVQDERASIALRTVEQATPALLTLAIKRISTALEQAEEEANVAKMSDSLIRALDAYHRHGGEAMTPRWRWSSRTVSGWPG